MNAVAAATAAAKGSNLGSSRWPASERASQGNAGLNAEAYAYRDALSRMHT